MTMNHSHRIRRLRWQVNAPDTVAAFALRSALRRENEHLMLSLASAFAAAHSGDDEILLPRLALHLRLSHPDRLREELPEQIHAAASSALAALLAPAETDRAVPRIHTAADRLGHYLLNGSLPWFDTAEESAVLVRTLSAEASAWWQTPADGVGTPIAMQTQHSYSHENTMEQGYAAALPDVLAALLVLEEVSRVTPHLPVAADRPGLSPLNENLSWPGAVQESTGLFHALSAEASVIPEPDRPTATRFSGETQAWLRLLAMMPADAAATFAFAFRYLQLLTPSEREALLKTAGETRLRVSQKTALEAGSRQRLEAAKDAGVGVFPPFQKPESTGLFHALSAEASVIPEPDRPTATRFSRETQAWLRLLAMMPTDAAAAFAFAFRYLQLLTPSERETLLKTAGETRLRVSQKTALETGSQQRLEAAKDAGIGVFPPFQKPESTGMHPQPDNADISDTHAPFVEALHLLLTAARDTGSNDTVLRRQAFSLVILAGRRFSEFTPPARIENLFTEVFGFPDGGAGHSVGEILPYFFHMPQMTQQEAVTPYPCVSFEEKTVHKTKAVEQSRSTDIAASTEAAISVFHSGLILLHPFLPRLFSTLNWIQEAGKLNASRLPNAAALLHWLATGSDTPYEFEFGLIKVLLGLRPEDPLPTAGGCLGAAEREEGAALLAAVVEHWSALRNTSTDGLRTAFLRRRGFLRPVDGGWSLHPENESFDLLLDALPWGIGIVKLPWMPVTIFTEWLSH